MARESLSPNPSPKWGGGPDGSRSVEPLRRLHDLIRGLVVAACEERSTEELTSVSHDGAGDVIYAIDEISETMLVDWFTREIAAREPIILIGEGLPDGRVLLPAGAKE